MYNLIGNTGSLDRFYLASNMRRYKAKVRKLDKLAKLARRRNRK